MNIMTLTRDIDPGIIATIATMVMMFLRVLK